MILLNPKTLEDAKTIIEKTVNVAPEGKLAGAQAAIDNFNNLCNMVDGFFRGCGSIGSFITKCFTNPNFLIDKIQGIAPDVFLIVLGTLIILRFLGFKNITKWINFTLVLAVIIAFL